MVVSALLMIAGISLVPVAYASPPDPTWGAGIYDEADYDDVVGLVTDGIGASSGQASARVERGPVACVPFADPGPVPDWMLRAQTGRGPPVEARDASIGLRSKPATLPGPRETTLPPFYHRISESGSAHAEQTSNTRPGCRARFGRMRECQLFHARRPISPIISRFRDRYDSQGILRDEGVHMGFDVWDGCDDAPFRKTWSWQRPLLSVTDKKAPTA